MGIKELNKFAKRIQGNCDPEKTVPNMCYTCKNCAGISNLMGMPIVGCTHEELLKITWWDIVTQYHNKPCPYYDKKEEI